MKVAYFDCFSGISGDMLLGALVACGADLAAIEAQVANLRLEGLEWSRQQVKRGALMGTQVVVRAPAGRSHRHLSQIEEIIRKAELPPRAENRAIAVFKRLGEVEAALHGWPVEKVHFHEIGALDSIADIVGNCVALELLGVDQLYCSALNVGGGAVKCDHGVLPVPAPASAELLKGLAVYSSGVESELVTPTGAAIVAVLAGRTGPMPAMKILAIGYGAGTRDHPGLPNLLRVTIGEAAEARSGLEPLVMIETNVDDMNPQLCGYFGERAFAAGALDVFFASVQMKKDRPGVVISVLCRPEHRDALMDLLFLETTTIGVRCYEVFRRALEREIVTVATRFGKVAVKVARQDGKITNFAPEYEQCRRLAEERSVPLREVLQEAAFAFLSQSRN